MMSKLVPELRFKEFSGEWEEKRLGDIGEFKGGGTPSKKVKEYWEGNIPWISSSDIDKNNIHNINISRYITEIALKKSATKLIPKNSILFISRVGVGKLAINKEELCTSQDFLNFISKKINNYYLAYFFQVKKNLLKSFNQGTSIKGFTKNDLSNLKILIPSTPQEQQKIADTLSSLDNLIEAQTKKVELLKSHKKGLMQKLFPRDGAKVPEVRFKEFSGEWEEKKLGDCLDYIQPTKYLVSSTDYNHNYNIPVLTAGKTFILGYTNETEGIFSEKLPVIIFDDFTTASKFVQFPFKAKSSAMKILIAKNNINIKFMYEAIQLIKYEVGNHGRHWISIFSKIKILIPPTPQEQQKIADTFSSLDNLIEAQNKKIELLKEHKKGLMQKMFVNKD